MVQGRARRRAAVVLAVLTTIVVGIASQAAAGAANAPGKGRQVDIGDGRRLYLRCAGSGSPTVVLESGIHDSSDPWTITDTRPPVPESPSVFAGLANVRRVCL